jgi:hypothetical protein
MLGSAAGRGTVVVFLIAAAVTAVLPRSSSCQAEPFESFARTLRTPLRQQRVRKVLLVIHTDDIDATNEPTPVEIESLRTQIAEVCRELSITKTEITGSRDLPESSLGVAPDPADWQALLKQEKADAVVSVTWKATKSGLAVRVSLLNDRKVVWNGRARLRRKPTSDGAALVGPLLSSGKMPGGGNFMGPMLGGSVGGWPSAAWDSTGSGNEFNTFNTGLTGQGTGGTSPAGQLPAGYGTSGNSTDLNAKIFEFARSHLGQQVGGGVCYELPVVAFETVGAQPATAGNDFGQEVSLTELIPGDVLQFWSVRLAGPLGVWQLGEPGHNAIVGEVRGKYVAVYHQNINGVRHVRLDVLDLGSLVSGQIIGYRAVAR